jgi:hypothetical protein
MQRRQVSAQNEVEGAEGLIWEAAAGLSCAVAVEQLGHNSTRLSAVSTPCYCCCCGTCQVAFYKPTALKRNADVLALLLPCLVCCYNLQEKKKEEDAKKADDDTKKSGDDEDDEYDTEDDDKEKAPKATLKDDADDEDEKDEL